MRCPRLCAVLAVVLIASVVRPAQGQITAEQVREAIKQGVDYLKRQQAKDGYWTEVPMYPGGMTSLCTLALLSCGVEPSDPAIQSALGYLRRTRADRTYSAALQTMVFCRAEPVRDGQLIRRNVGWLEQVQITRGSGKGGWGYPSNDPDNSNSQFALLALYEAERVGVRVSPQTWRLAKAYWEEGQHGDGSWGYKQRDLQGTGSMTSAGISSLVIANGKIQQPDAEVQQDRILCCRRVEADSDRVRRALEWLAGNFAVSHNPRSDQRWHYYYLYGLERVGRMTNGRFIGQHDWYREGADYLVKAKGGALADYWEGQGLEGGKLLPTSFALLFLSKGRWPVLVSKLKHGSGEEWNQHRNDVGNLTQYVELKWSRDLVWQVVDLGAATVDDLVQSPVLYLCGINSPLPSSAQAQEELVRKLRDYLDRGGFLLAEGYCGGAGFDEGFRKLMAKVFPEPEYKLQVLPPEHPIWRAEEPVSDVREVLGIEFGCRTSVVYCPQDHSERLRPPLSGLWELSRSGREQKYSRKVQGQIDDALRLGINIMAYATNRELQFKDVFLTTAAGKGQSDKIDRGKLYVASLRHPGGCTAAPRALSNLLRSAAEELKVRVSTEPREVAMTDPALFDQHLVFMHGRNAFRLTEAERKQLKTYLQRGGMVFANAICASKPFVESFRREMQTMFPEHPLGPIPAGDPLWTKKYGGFDLPTVTRRDPQARAKDQPLKALERKVPPELEGLRIGDRYAVIFSPYDLSCALEKQDTMECQGYTRDDAARIGLNVVLYSLQQ